jgi:hypothetical protein
MQCLCRSIKLGMKRILYLLFRDLATAVMQISTSKICVEHVFVHKLLKLCLQSAMWRLRTTAASTNGDVTTVKRNTLGRRAGILERSSWSISKQ